MSSPLDDLHVRFKKPVDVLMLCIAICRNSCACAFKIFEIAIRTSTRAELRFAEQFDQQFDFQNLSCMALSHG